MAVVDVHAAVMLLNPRKMKQRKRKRRKKNNFLYAPICEFNYSMDILSRKQNTP